MFNVVHRVVDIKRQFRYDPDLMPDITTQDITDHLTLLRYFFNDILILFVFSIV